MSTSGLLLDRRLTARVDRLAAALTTLRTISIASLARTWAEQMAFYRLLSNERVTIGHLAERLFTWMEAPWWRKRSMDALQAPHLLLIQDTTEVSFEAHAGRLRSGSGLGWLSNNRQHGYCLHPALAVDASAGSALGFADIRLWARPLGQPDKHERSYRDLPIEEKESFRWIAATQEAAKRLGPEVRLTTIADREADIYSLFARLPEGCDAIIRACRDRRIDPSGAAGQAPRHLYAFLRRQPVCGTETIRLRGDVRRRQAGREVRLTYRFGLVTLRRPERSAKPDAKGKRDPRRLRLWAVEIAETGAPKGSAPKGSAPICWRLLTTHPVESFEQARRIGAWYRQRWHIEQVFRLLKADGFDLESSELESGQGLQRLGILALGAALDVLRLLLAERSHEDLHEGQPLEHVFDEQEQACLTSLNEQVQGRTEKQRNPHPVGSLAWAAWVIARLGGWSGYASQHRAGPATYHRGLERFHAISEGWHLAHRDLYKP